MAVPGTESSLLIQQTQHQYLLDQMTDDELVKLNRAMHKVEKEIVHQWGKAGMRTEFSQSRAITMLEETRKLTAATRSTMSTSVADTLGKVSYASAKAHSKILSFGGKAANVQDVILDAKAMTSFWQTTPVGGHLLKDWVDKSFDKHTIDKIQQEIAAGLFRGESYTQLAKRFNAGFGMTKNEIDTLVRTYVRTANTDAMLRVYEQNKDLYDGLRWTASINSHTCLLCASLEGKRYPIDKHPPCPVHPRCRCTLLPDLKSLAAMGMTGKTLKAYNANEKMGPENLRKGYRGRELFEHGELKSNMKEWALSQDTPSKLKMFGPTRLKMLDAGLIEWDDLVDLDQLRIRTVKELLGEATLTAAAKMGVPEAVAALKAKAEAKKVAEALAEENALQKAVSEAEARKAFALKKVEAEKAKKKLAEEEAELAKATAAEEVKKADLKAVEDAKEDYYKSAKKLTDAEAANSVIQLNLLEMKVGHNLSTKADLDDVVKARANAAHTVQVYMGRYAKTDPDDLDKKVHYLGLINKNEALTGPGYKLTTYADIEDYTKAYWAKKAVKDAKGGKAKAEAQANLVAEVEAMAVKAKAADEAYEIAKMEVRAAQKAKADAVKAEALAEELEAKAQAAALIAKEEAEAAAKFQLAEEVEAMTVKAKAADEAYEVAKAEARAAHKAKLEATKAEALATEKAAKEAAEELTKNQVKLDALEKEFIDKADTLTAPVKTALVKAINNTRKKMGLEPSVTVASMETKVTVQKAMKDAIESLKKDFPNSANKPGTITAINAIEAKLDPNGKLTTLEELEELAKADKVKAEVNKTIADMKDEAIAAYESTGTFDQSIPLVDHINTLLESQGLPVKTDQEWFDWIKAEVAKKPASPKPTPAAAVLSPDELKLKKTLDGHLDEWLTMYPWDQKSALQEINFWGDQAGKPKLTMGDLDVLAEKNLAGKPLAGKLTKAEAQEAVKKIKEDAIGKGQHEVTASWSKAANIEKDHGLPITKHDDFAAEVAALKTGAAPAAKPTPAAPKPTVANVADPAMDKAVEDALGFIKNKQASYDVNPMAPGGPSLEVEIKHMHILSKEVKDVYDKGGPADAFEKKLLAAMEDDLAKVEADYKQKIKQIDPGMDKDILDDYIEQIEDVDSDMVEPLWGTVPPPNGVPAPAAKPAPVAKPAPAAKPVAAKPTPASIPGPGSLAKVKTIDGSQFTQYKSQKGSNSGGFYQSNTDPDERYYFKFPKSDEHIGNEILASKMYRALGVNVPELSEVNLNGRRGLASKIVDITEDKAAITGGKFKAEIEENFVVDAWMANWDAVGLSFDNLVVEKATGKILRVDVGGSLLYRAQGGLKGDVFGAEVKELKTLLDKGLNPTSAQVFAGVTRDDIVAGVKKIAALSDNDIKAMIDVYGPDSQLLKAELKDILIARKEWLLKEYPEAVQAKVPAAPAKAKAAPVTAVDDTFVKEVKALGYQGKSVPFDKDHIEDQNALVFTETFNGKERTVVRMKTRKVADKGIIDALSPDAVNKRPSGSSGTIGKAAVPTGPQPLKDDKYYNTILLAVKNIGYHKANGSTPNALKYNTMMSLKGDLGVLAATTKDDDLFKMATEYLKWIEKAEDAYAGKGSISGVFNQYKVDPPKPKAAAPTSAPSAPAMSGPWVNVELDRVWNTRRKTVNGRMEVIDDRAPTEDFFPQHRSSIAAQPGKQYTVEYGDGTRLRYVPHDQGTFYSQHGELELTIPGPPTKEAIAEALDKLKRLGVDSKVSDALDVEKMYLEKLAYIRKWQTENDWKTMVGGWARKTTEEKVIEARAFISKKLKVADITALPDYDPHGKYQMGFTDQSVSGGQRVQLRPDISDADLDREMPDYVLYHNLTNASTLADSIKMIMENNGAMIATNEKIRLGVPAGGLSPDDDMGTGGSNYFFTRLHDPRKPPSDYNHSSYKIKGGKSIIFNKNLVRRMDAISYNRDRYGKTLPGFVESNRARTIAEMQDNAHGRTDNETIFKQSVNLLETVDVLIARDDADRAATIAVFKSLGVKHLPDGRRIEDAVILMSDWHIRVGNLK